MEATPLDEAWERIADEAYRRHVEPALQEMREVAEEQKVLTLLRHATWVDAVKKIGAASLGLLGANAAAIPDLVGAAVGVGGEVVTAMIARHRELVSRQRASGFLFLYEADKRLAR